MEKLWPALFLSLCALGSTGSLTAQGHTPIPPGIRAADKAEQNSERSIPPPDPPLPKIDSRELLQQADELLTLAQQVHVDTKQATEGLLAKDLRDKLKRIEKLSKHLREELTP
jgi:hypothetical protein